jgi:hypothetical protein
MQIKFLSIATFVACLATVAQASPLQKRNAAAGATDVNNHPETTFNDKIQVIKDDPDVQDAIDFFISLVSADLDSTASPPPSFDERFQKVTADTAVKDVFDYFTQLIAQGIEKQNSAAPPPAATGGDTTAPPPQVTTAPPPQDNSAPPPPP